MGFTGCPLMVLQLSDESESLVRAGGWFACGPGPFQMPAHRMVL